MQSQWRCWWAPVRRHGSARGQVQLNRLGLPSQRPWRVPQGKLRIGLGEQAMLNSLGWASLLHREDSHPTTPKTADDSPAKVHLSLQYIDSMHTWWRSPNP